MLRNAGAQITAYHETREPLPFEVLAAFAYKPERAPFRVGFTFHDLQRWNLSYTSPLAIQTANLGSSNDEDKGQV